jgi:outer membrane protein
VRFIVKRSVIVVLATAMAGFAQLAAAQAKIGVVNTDLLLQNSPQYRAAQENISAEFAPRQREIQALQQLAVTQEEKLRKDGATMSELQRTQAEKELRDNARSLQSKSEAAEEDFNTRRDEEMAKLQRVLREEIATYAKAQGFDIILVSGVGYATATYDVTQPLLEALRKKAGVTAPAAAPAAAPKPATGAAPKPATGAAPKPATP